MEDKDFDRLARGVIFEHFGRTPLERDELISLAYIGYRKAKNNFNADFEILSKTYVKMYMRQEINRALKKETRDKHVLIEEEDLLEKMIDEKCGTYFNETLSNIEWVNIKDTLSKTLTKEQEYIIVRMLFQEATLQEVSEELSITKEWVRQLKNKALKVLKNEYT